MGQKNITVTFCDLCGHENLRVSRSKLVWDGHKWQLDLCDYCRDNVTQRIFQIPGLDLLDRHHKPKGAAYKAAEGVNLTEVREWARQSGIEVSKRGRIDSKTIDLFKMTNGNDDSASSDVDLGLDGRIT
jgi:hypothetical protein